MADEAGTANGTKRAGRVTTLNSRRLTGAVIKRVARALELPTAAALEDIRQMIDGKLSEQGRDPRDVQVIQTEVEAEADTDTDAVGGVAIELRDSTGPFLTIDPDAETELDGDGGRETPRPTSPAAGIPTEEHLPRDDPRVVDLQKQILELQERNASLTDEVSKLKREIQRGKQKYRELWRLNCEQLQEWDDMLVEKDAVIERLTSRVTTLEGSGGAEPASHIVIRSHPAGFKPVERTPPASSSSPTEPGPVRRGKAPPVDPFDGEGGCVPFEDWLPSLERAAIWNGWSESDRLVQLAGHLRKRALQEWNLLTEEEKSSFAAATEALHNRLDPHSRILAAQEFRYAVQYDDESVADYIRRLELAYRKAYGREKMSNETRDALLFGQLQEGLKYALVRAPAVSGAQGYQQLCTAARNKERRLMELGRHRQNSRPQQATSPHRQQQLIPELSTPVTGTTPQRTGYSTLAPSSQTRKCFHCHQPGHFARNCPARRSKQTDPTPGAIAEAKQVCTHTEPSAQPTKLHSDPHHTGARDTNPVRVPDKGSRPRQANVIIGGVPTYGAVDSGADITIMGGDLFRHVASAGNLKKRNFKPADKIPRSYDQRTFKLDGKVDMDITFCGTTMRTPVYIKLDAAEQLLLSEGVCHQLGIIFYHSEVQPVHHRTMSGRKYKQPSWVTLPVPSEERRESGSTSLTSENSMLLTSPSEERTQSGTSTTLTSDRPLLPVPSEERRESGSTSLTSENSMLLTSPSEERRQSGTSTTLTSDGPLLPVPSEERRESGSTSLTSENSMLLTSPSEERRQSGTSTTLTSEGPLLPVPSEECRESGSTSLTSENSMLLTSPSEERTQSGTSTTLTSDGPLLPVPSEERRESGSTSLTSENSMLLTSPSEERRQSGTSTTLTSEGPLLPVPSEERRESGSTSLTSENSMLLTSPSEERTQSGTSTTLTSDGPLLPVPSEERRESGSTSLTSENSMLLTSPSEERRQSGTSTTLTSDRPLLPVPSEERRESGSTSLTSENSMLLTSPSEERTQSGTSTTLTSEGPLLPVPSEERRESGSTSLTSENSMLLTSPSEERTQSGTSTKLTSDGPLLPVPSEERRESGSTSLTSENSMLLTSPSEERTQSGTSTTLTSDGPLLPVPSEERRESGSTSLTSENSMLLTSPSEERRQSGTSTTLTSDGPLLPVPSEERRQSGTSTTLTSEGPLLPVPSEERRESGSTSHTSENSMLLTSPSEERRQSGTSTTLTSDRPLRPVPSEESRESGSTSFTSENSVLLTSPRESDMRVVTTSFKNSLADVQVRLVRSVRLLPNHSQEVLVKLEGDSLSSPLLVEGTADLRLETELVAEDTLVSPAANGMATIVLHNPSGFTQVVDTGSVIGKASRVSVESPQDATSRPVIAMKGASCPENHSCQGHNTEPETMETAVRRVECVSASTHDRTRRAQMIQNFFGDTSVPAEYREQLLQLLVQYDQLFSLDEGERGETKVVEFQIDTGNSPPIRQRARRMPFAARAEVARQLRALQLTGVVRASSSPWASPVVLVRKKDGSHRFCVDYRWLNAVTKLDSYPLPRIDDLLDQLAHARYFTILDLASGYWQIRVHEDSVPKTAFITPQGLYEFRVMPFGLTNAPSTFQRLMQQLLAGLNPSQDTAFVSVYIDDVLIYLHTMEEHLVHLRTVLQRLAEAGLKLKPEKCHFVRQEVEFLGHVITPKGLKTTARLVSAVEEFQQPTNAKQTRQFLGLCSFYRRFIPGFAKIAKPLHQLTRVGIPFSWTVERQRAFVMLKKKLCEAPVLAYPSFDKDFVLETDASTDGIGAVLSQRQEDSCMHPVAFASRSLSPAERNYGITDLETLTVVWAVSHFRCYLYGHAVTIYTDHSAVRAVLENPNSSGRHARWWTRVYSSGIKSVNIVYRPGKANSNADALSRNPVQVAPDEGIGESEVQVAAISSESVTPTTTISQLLHSSPPVLESQSFAVEQQKDKELADMVQYLQSKALPVGIHGSQRVLSQSPLFMLIDGVLYFIRKGCTPCPAVPQHLRQRLMEEHHRGPCGSHFGGKKLFQTMSRQWWWEGMHKDIMHFVRNCPECTIVSMGRKTVHPPLHPIPVQRPFQILGVDIMDLPLTKQGNRHILVFQDHFSKWPMVYAIPDQKAHRIAQILCDEIIPMFGVPEALLSDRGTNLLSHLMKDVCQILGIKKLNTTAYHPQCNGMVERLNRTLKAMLRKHAGRFGTQWDQFLPGVLWAYRNTPHETTGEKPSFLLFGVDLRTPSQAALFPPALPDPTTIEDYRETLITTLSSATGSCIHQEVSGSVQEAIRRKGSDT